MKSAKPSSVVAGIFVGGQSRRMGGRPKGLLLVSSAGRDPETIVARWKRLFDVPGVETVLVGARDAYASLGIDGLDDDPPGIGPLGGLIALLTRARGRTAIAVACDMPYVSPALLAKLMAHPSPAFAVAAKRGGTWEPLFARYAGPRPLEIARSYAESGQRSLHGVLALLGAEALTLSDDELEELRDWDTLPGKECV
jgi:molybdenum cofactor guanylyltransferase